jgi:alcohol dehydrogenase (NADP+)
VIDLQGSRAYPETWKAMEKLVQKGKARAIGVSNFNILKMRRLLETATVIPAVNQVELHPLVPLDDNLAKFLSTAPIQFSDRGCSAPC